MFSARLYAAIAGAAPRNGSLLNKFTLAAGEGAHAQQNNAVFKARNVGTAIGAFAVTNGHFHYFEVEFVGAEKQIKITEGIKFSEVSSVFDQF